MNSELCPLSPLTFQPLLSKGALAFSCPGCFRDYIQPSHLLQISGAHTRSSGIKLGLGILGYAL